MKPWHTVGLATLIALALAGQAYAAPGPYIAVEEDGGCAIRTDGTVACGGHDDLFEPPGTFTALASGHDHLCGIRTDLTLACWGTSEAGHLDVPAGTFRAISGGYASHNCAIRADGTLACWGSNDRGQSEPRSGSFTSVETAYGRTCALRTDATLTCWGYDGDAGATDAPPGAYKAVAIGMDHTCAIRASGTLACWGANGDGQANAPRGTFTSVSAGWGSTCAIRTDGTLVCTGTLHDDTPAGAFTRLSHGAGHACGIRTDGTVTCWGLFSPVAWSNAVPAGPHTAISAGDWNTCAISTERAVACWGLQGWQSTESFGDPTPPVVQPTITGQQGSNGWHLGDVTVTWNVTDPETRVVSQTGCQPASLTTDTPATKLTCTATGAGTTTETVTIRRDTVAPDITCPPAPNADGTITATVTDATSGPAAPIITTPTEATAGGGRRATLTTTDLAGNRTSAICSYLPNRIVVQQPRPASPIASPPPAACQTRRAIANALRRALGRRARIRRASIRTGDGGTARRLGLNRRRTAIRLPTVLKPGETRITVSFKQGRRIRTLRRTFNAC